MRYSRISITLPADTLASADALARRDDRSRSWVLAEALRRYAEAAPVTVPDAIVGSVPDQPTRTSVLAVGAALADGYRSANHGLDSSRLAQLERDMALSPEARVREAEETVRLSELVHSDVPPSGPRGFERYEAFLDWQQFGRLVEA